MIGNFVGYQHHHICGIPESEVIGQMLLESRCPFSVFKTQPKKLPVLLPWILNHKHKIEEKF